MRIANPFWTPTLNRLIKTFSSLIFFFSETFTVHTVLLFILIKSSFEKWVIFLFVFISSKVKFLSSAGFSYDRKASFRSTREYRRCSSVQFINALLRLRPSILRGKWVRGAGTKEAADRQRVRPRKAIARSLESLWYNMHAVQRIDLTPDSERTNRTNRYSGEGYR